MRYLLIFLTLISFSFGDNLAVKLDNLIKTKQVQKVVILKYDPFFIKKDTIKSYKNKEMITKKIQVKHLNLVTIINNKAFINGRWLSEGDTINGYKVKNIYANKVVILKKNKRVVLSFEQKQDILKIREK